jgi:hypothetical protein
LEFELVLAPVLTNSFAAGIDPIKLKMLGWQCAKLAIAALPQALLSPTEKHFPIDW